MKHHARGGPYPMLLDAYAAIANIYVLLKGKSLKL
jgi:hypothetical protein